MRSLVLKWAALGGLTAVILLTAQISAVGGPAGLLQVGETSALRPLVEAELGQVPVAPGPGHDGQIYYAMGLDLDGDEVAPLLDHGAYRYRRILFPLLASGFGLFDGPVLLWGMIVAVVASTAVASAALAVAGRRLGLSEWVALSVVLNPGVWLSVRLLTADVLAIALMSSGLYLYAQRPTTASSAFALSGLAKDVFVVTPVALALTARRRWRSLVLTPVALLGAWSLWLSLTLGDGFTPRQNLTWPLNGIRNAWANWVVLGGEEWFYLAFALASVVMGLVAGLRGGWLRWPLLAWSALAMISSNWIWDFGNNAARAFAPLLPLVALARGQVGAGTGSPTVDAAADTS